MVLFGDKPTNNSVHPRVCGEHRCKLSCNSSINGSSPRVRGTFRTQWYRQSPRRFIPACAGNIRLPSLRRSVSTVHPRVCGEHPDCTQGLVEFHGSSPRVRGTYFIRRRGVHQKRFIPACAGNIKPRRHLPFDSSVHPRVCGEHFPCITPGLLFNGSSPRVRGT